MSPDDFQRVHDEVVDVVASPRIHIPTTNTSVLLYSTTWQELFSNTTTTPTPTSNTTTTTTPTISEAVQWLDIGLNISMTVAGLYLYLRWLYKPHGRMRVYPPDSRGRRDHRTPAPSPGHARATPDPRYACYWMFAR
jgi:hypothetical protein